MFGFTQSDREQSLQRENDKLRQQLAESLSRITILELERDELLEVIERNRQRVAAETKEWAAKSIASEKQLNPANVNERLEY